MTTTQLSEDRKQHLADLATEVVADHCVGLPIQPTDIIRGQQLTLSFGYYGVAFDGMLECRAARFHIYCNLSRVESPTSARARFTLCHELGHFFIDSHRTALASGCPPHPSESEYNSRSPVEREADFFAGRLLMPENAFRSKARGSVRGLTGILSLANAFQTSLTSTAIRYAELELVPCAVIKWGPDGFGWRWVSTETFRARYRTTLDRTSLLPPDSATARALRGVEPPSKGFFENGTTAAAWFRGVAGDSYRNALFIEQAVSLGRHGALTFLFPESRAF